MDLRHIYAREKGYLPDSVSMYDKQYIQWLEVKASRMQNVMDRWRSWSDETFGVSNQRVVPILYHLKKEVPELIESIQDRVVGTTEEDIRLEFADCFSLLFDAASHYGYSAEDILKAMMDKLDINRKRKWGKPDENGVVEHLK